jgi:hypothetical protein
MLPAAGLKMGIPAEDDRRYRLNRAEEGFAVLQSSRPESEVNRTLEEITRSAMHLTGASGAALALSDGKTMSCQACTGHLAPPVGTRLSIETGLTATCVQTAEVVRCDDTEADPRVDSSKCVGIRSILAVPVFDNPNVAGVLEVLSGIPQRFTDKHVTALQLLARLVESHVNYASRGDAASDVKPTHADSGATNADAASGLCLSCGHPNPEGSQFCNRCGVIICTSGPIDKASDLGLPAATGSVDYEGVREIFKLIAGGAGLATWNDIYPKLLANLQSTSAKDKPGDATENIVEKEGTANLFEKPEGPNEITAQAGAALRRSLWR